MQKIQKKMNKGFTLVELIVTVGIFVVMTGLMVAKYGTFDQGVLLTNLAYDIALNIRTAQSYGLNAKGSNNVFDNITYTTRFVAGEKKFILIGGEVNATTNIKGGSSIKSVCAGSGPGGNCSTNIPALVISFRRPDPSAMINGSNAYGEIVVQSKDGSSTRTIVIRSTGQISVQ